MPKYNDRSLRTSHLNMAKPSRRKILGIIGPFPREVLTMPPADMVQVISARILKVLGRGGC